MQRYSWGSRHQIFMLFRLHVSMQHQWLLSAFGGSRGRPFLLLTIPDTALMILSQSCGSVTGQQPLQSTQLAAEQRHFSGIPTVAAAAALPRERSSRRPVGDVSGCRASAGDFSVGRTGCRCRGRCCRRGAGQIAARAVQAALWRCLCHVRLHTCRPIKSSPAF